MSKFGWSWASINGLYNTPSWTKLRKLKKSNNPICEMCASMGKYTPAYCIDHIIPIDEDNWQQLFLDYDNLQSLCDPCHKFKTNRDKGDKYHKYEGETGKDLMDMIDDL